MVVNCWFARPVANHTRTCTSLYRNWKVAVREFARHRLRPAAYDGETRAVVEQMMQQEAMRVRLHGQPAAEPPYADFFAWAGQQPAAARGGGGG